MKFHEEVMKLREIFTSNGYSVSFFDRVVGQFLRKKLSPKHKPVDDDDSKRFILVIPYLGKPSLLLKKRITDLIKDMYPRIRFFCVFQSFKVKNYFSLKSVPSKFLLSKVVYLFKCRRDPTVSYIGETRRHLGIRVSEHLNFEHPTSSIGDHIKDCDQCKTDVQNGALTFNDFEVLRRGFSDFDIRVKEFFLIRKHKPQLNKQLMNAGILYQCRIFV